MNCCHPFVFSSQQSQFVMNCCHPFVFSSQQPQFEMKCCHSFCFCFFTTATKYVFTLYLSRGMYYRVFDESWKKGGFKGFHPWTCVSLRDFVNVEIEMKFPIENCVLTFMLCLIRFFQKYNM